MHPSMCRKTNKANKLKVKLVAPWSARRKLVEILKPNRFTLWEVQGISGVSKSTVRELKKLILRKEDVNINSILKETVCSGRKPVFSAQEEKMISERIIEFAKREFFLGVEGVKKMMSRIAPDGRKGWKNGVPSDNTARVLRSCNRELTYRKTEIKDHAKLPVEQYGHANHFFEILEDVDKKHVGILSKPNRIVICT